MASSVASKLLIKEGMRVLVMNAPGRPAELIGPLPKGATLVIGAEGPADGVLLFVRDRSELDQYLELGKTAATDDRLFWICYPKGSARTKININRDVIRELLEGTDAQVVSAVAVDRVWSALRVRPASRLRPD